MVTIHDVPCLSCQHGYNSQHECDEPRYCACDRTEAHVLPPDERSRS